MIAAVNEIAALHRLCALCDANAVRVDVVGVSGIGATLQLSRLGPGGGVIQAKHGNVFEALAELLVKGAELEWFPKSADPIAEGIVRVAQGNEPACCPVHGYEQRIGCATCY